VAAATTISLPQLRAFCRDAFERAGLSGPDSGTGAEVLSTTDAWGVFTHGSKALRGYLRRLQAGGLRARGRPGIVAEGPAWAVVDGDCSLGMVTSVFAMTTAIGKARRLPERGRDHLADQDLAGRRSRAPHRARRRLPGAGLRGDRRRPARPGGPAHRRGARRAHGASAACRAARVAASWYPWCG